MIKVYLLHTKDESLFNDFQLEKNLYSSEDEIKQICIDANLKNEQLRLEHIKEHPSMYNEDGSNKHNGMTLHNPYTNRIWVYTAFEVK